MPKYSKSSFFLILIIIGLIFTSGIMVGLFIPKFFPDSSIHSKDKEINQLFEPFFQAWDIVKEQYLWQPVDEVAMMRGAIRGMMESLDDPDSAYMDPEEYEALNTTLQGEYTGIGAWVDTTGDYLVIISPMPNSPAEEVGLKPGDKVVMISGEDVTYLDPALVLERILGPAGTYISISVQREGENEPLIFKIKREVILIPSLESELIEENIGYVRLYTFGANSSDELLDAYTKLIKEGATGLILDLRNNTGGYVDTAVEIVSLFIPSGTILIEEWADGSTNEYKATGNPVAPEIPLVLLVNEGSASASEITAGALQDYHRAIILGSQTFGKGLIQNWIPLQNDNGAIRVTIARWLTPDGRQIQENGLTPDVLVEITEKDIEDQFDAQLEEAKKQISQLINRND